MSEKDKQGVDWETATLKDISIEHLREKKRSRRWKIFFQFLAFAYASVFLLSMVDWSGVSQNKHTKHTAVVSLKGVIADGQAASAEEINKLLRSAFEDDGSEAVVLKINSPGGTPVQADRIYHEILRMRELHADKPLYAVVGDLCASGGYYVASAADKIYAAPASMIGSIGVRMDAFGVQGLMEKLGVERRTIVAGKNKALLDPFAPQNPEQREHLQAMLNDVHQQFIDAVKKGRGDRLKESPELFSGLIWTGDEALNRGLIDGFGDLRYVAEEVIGQKELRYYRTEKSLIEQLTEGVGVRAGTALAGFLKQQTQSDYAPQLQ
ncbi:MAG: signal peptide peptidase SppA [Thiotrichales bacterium]